MAVINSPAAMRFTSCLATALLLSLLLAIVSNPSYAAVLPEERADLMYHRYEGGGMVIDGPSLLLRKNIGDNVSVSANYYVDKVSSASIDVKTQSASRYSEQRDEYSADISYLYDKTTMNVGFTRSEENDYEASNYRFDISHAFFAEMTTISAGFSLGDDDISSSRDANFADSLERRNYRFGFSQILSANLLLNLNYEAVVDEGYTQNPYRVILLTWCGNGPAASPSSLEACDVADRRAKLAPENYPRTRNSDAFSLKLSYHLPWDAALKTRLGYFSDSWGIDSSSTEFDYSQRLNPNTIVDLRLRYYQQGDAEFYANQFYALQEDPEQADIPVTFYGRDKELSKHHSYSIGAGISHRRELNQLFTSLELNAQIDYFRFDYDNFLEYNSTPAGDVLAAPRYSFDAYALRLFATLRY